MPEHPTDEIAVAWADYRKEFGVAGGSLIEAHKAFRAGWEAARGMTFEGPLR